MIRDPRLQSWLLTLLCVLLLLRVEGAHLHLCFDGNEPPASIHLLDIGIHHGSEPGMSAPHQDQDVSLSDEALFKASQPGFDFPPVLLAALLLWALLRTPIRLTPPSSTPVAPSASRVLLPPLRGPPSLTSR